jgi:hypothetical protein
MLYWYFAGRLLNWRIKVTKPWGARENCTGGMYVTQRAAVRAVMGRAHQGAPLVSVATSEKVRALPLVPGLQAGHDGDGLATQQRLPSTHTAHESPSWVTALPAGHLVQAASIGAGWQGSSSCW